MNSALLLQELPTSLRSEGNQISSEDRKTDWLLGRVLLFKVYRECLNLADNSLELFKSEHGKPYFKNTFPFNLSHSKNFVGLAVLKETTGLIGLDLQEPQKGQSFDSIGKRYFTSTENKMLSNLPTDLQSNFFYKTWTFKEAYSKARGRGLHKELNQISQKNLSKDPSWKIFSFKLDGVYGNLVAHSNEEIFSSNIQSYTWDLDSNSFIAQPMKFEIFEDCKDEG